MVELIFLLSKLEILEIFEIGNFWVEYKLSNDQM